MKRITFMMVCTLTLYGCLHMQETQCVDRTVSQSQTKIVSPIQQANGQLSPETQKLIEDIVAAIRDACQRKELAYGWPKIETLVEQGRLDQSVSSAAKDRFGSTDVFHITDRPPHDVPNRVYQEWIVVYFRSNADNDSPVCIARIGGRIEWITAEELDKSLKDQMLEFLRRLD